MTNDDVWHLVAVLTVGALVICGVDQFLFYRKLSEEQRAKFRTPSSNRLRFFCLIVWTVFAFTMFPGALRICAFGAGVCVLALIFEDLKLRALASAGLETDVINSARMKSAVALLTLTLFFLTLCLFEN